MKEAHKVGQSLIRGRRFQPETIASRGRVATTQNSNHGLSADAQIVLHRQMFGDNAFGEDSELTILFEQANENARINDRRQA